MSRSSCAVAVLAASAVLSACSPASTADIRTARAAHGTGDILIGVAWPWQARAEMRFGDGLDMAVAEVNAAGGINGRRLRLVRGDDHESADDGRALAQRFEADPNIVAVIGHLQSFVSVPAASIYENGGLVMVAPAATDPELTAQGYHRVFRATFTDKDVGHRMADYAAAHGYHRVAIEYVRSTYGRDLANAFEERATDLGIAVTVRQSYGADGVTEDTFEPTVHDWASLDVDAIFLAGEVPSAAYFVTAARRAGIAQPILAGDALGSPTLLSIAGRAADGMVVPAVFHADEPRPEVQQFATAFKQRFGTPPGEGSALGYDAVQLLATAMRDAHSAAPDAVAASLHHLRGWRGVTGAFSFDSAGDLVDRPIVTMIVRNGRFDYLPAAPRIVASTPHDGRAGDR